jgi:PadR family transcriptional regulator, regulatory protein PadR
MADEPRLSLQVLKVLQVFLEQPGGQFSGTDLLTRTSLASGTLYPILLRLERAGWLRSQWEALDPRAAGRPRRRYYSITPLGIRRAEGAMREIGLAPGRTAWA